MTSAPQRICWRGDNPRGAPLLLVRHTYRPGRGWGLHRHDFAEMFWVESGGGVHLVNGVEQALAAGDVVCLRPADLHLSRAGRDGLTVVNASFAPAAVAALARRHRRTWPWRAGGAPLHFRLLPPRMERLHAWASELSLRCTAVDRDAFLLDVARLLAAPQAEDADASLPGWLRDALAVFADPRHLGGGTAALARLAGRTPEHLNRVVRRAQGRTATDLVVGLRLDHAAAALRMSDRAIAAIADEVGLANLGHFYARFRARFGTTPRRYRLGARQVTT